VGGNPYAYDEYEICVGIKESIEKKDFDKLQAWSRKPLFGFIEVELVKPFKLWASNPPFEPTADGDINGAIVTPENKQKALDALVQSLLRSLQEGQA